VDIGRRLVEVAAPVRELDRARLGWVAAEQAGPLELRQVRVHGRRRAEPDRLAYLPDGRWIAVLVDERPQVVEDRALPLGHHLVSFREHVFDHGSVPAGRRQESGKPRSGAMRWKG
jgi:hypothetical protein